jgi:hypothetical protein
MATSLSSLLALAALTQAPPAGPPASAADDSLAALRAQLERDSTDGRAWLGLGRVYLRIAEEQIHGASHAAPDGSAGARARLDTAEQAFARAAPLLGGPGSTPEGDSARVLRVSTWSARSLLIWEERGSAASPQEWGPLPPDLKLPPELEELGENLLRACPTHGVLLTASDADAAAAWYMRFARGLRPDLLVVPLAAWRADPVLRRRLAADLQLGRHSGGDGWLPELAKRRAVCVSMAFDRPPDARGRIKWTTQPLVWVAGPVQGDRVPPRDFVFAALRLALDERAAWAPPALALYTRAARATPALCEALATFKLTGEISSCRR